MQKIRPERRVYLGQDPHDGHVPLWSAPRDSVAVVGPPGYGKTSGVLIPALLHWDGPAVVTSTRSDLVQATGDHRRAVATSGPFNGAVHIYDPLEAEGYGSLRWSPAAGCANASVCYRRVQAMTSTIGSGVSDGEHWRSGAALILRGLLHAAALAQAPMTHVRRWIAHQATEEPAGIIRAHPATEAAHDFADDLEGLALIGERERGSFYSMARTTLDLMADPRVRASAAAIDLDIDQFLTSKSTLYVVGPNHYQAAIAPLIVALVDAIAQRAAELAAAQGGRLDPPLLLALDEVANIAPLDSLPSLVSEGGGRGITTVWAAQSLAQMRQRYGADGAQAILTASTAKLIYGAMSSDQDLRNVSAWAGETRVPEITHHGATTGGYPIPDRAVPPASPTTTRTAEVGGVGLPTDQARQHSVSGTYRPALPTEAIQMLPPGQAWLFYGSETPLEVSTPPAGTLPAYRDAAGYTP
ncbi:type IV secretory system conjugative DNA transfer family protein [Halostreptopolyspora alba]|uniref:Type IV secretory system conjugative DNA transfer family protein n=1 Tax=Halostreptopolyspora alba TaxID=2487137 RepID=A0A3N0DYP7_9ACTN|nr:type IV secretory system conjugative DNA transfer family protein [Nocardiopsaceae bacterium YIM 96095]